MADKDDSKIHSAAPQGIVATHPTQGIPPLLVAPTTAKDFNTLGLGLVPVACLQLSDILFEFDSSFVTPNAESIVGQLPVLRLQHKNSKGELPPLAIFGHADPVGDDEYNKQLSGRRAKAVYGLLTHDLGLWGFLFDNPLGGDDWHAKKALDTMRQRVGPGAPADRKQLLKAYMNALSPAPLVKNQDFLARGADAKGKGDYQGCSEFNLLVSLSTADNAKLSKAKRDQENQPNRRVVVYLFRAGAKVDAALWPCPNADQPTAGCRKRFFVTPPAGDVRRKAGPQRREHGQVEDTPRDTFACRFYDQISHLSPCERKITLFRVRLLDKLGFPVPGAPYLSSEGAPAHGFASPAGDVTLHDVKVPSTCTIRWSRTESFKGSVAPDADPKPGDFEFSLEVFIDVDAAPSTEAAPAGSGPQDAAGTEATRRLHNLGFSMGETLEENIMFFQRELALEETGLLKDIDAELKKRHEECDPPSRYKLGSNPPPPPDPGPQPPIPTPDGPADFDFS